MNKKSYHIPLVRIHTVSTRPILYTSGIGISNGEADPTTPALAPDRSNNEWVNYER